MALFAAPAIAGVANTLFSKHGKKSANRFLKGITSRKSFGSGLKKLNTKNIFDKSTDILLGKKFKSGLKHIHDVFGGYNKKDNQRDIIKKDNRPLSMEEKKEKVIKKIKYWYLIQSNKMKKEEGESKESFDKRMKEKIEEYYSNLHPDEFEDIISYMLDYVVRKNRPLTEAEKEVLEDSKKRVELAAEEWDRRRNERNKKLAKTDWRYLGVPIGNPLDNLYYSEELNVIFNKKGDVFYNTEETPDDNDAINYIEKVLSGNTKVRLPKSAYSIEKIWEVDNFNNI